MSTLSITTIQTDIHWQNKAANLESLTKKIAGIGAQTEVVVLPEMFSTGFTMDAKSLAEPMNGETVQWMKDTAVNNKIVLTGSLIIVENGRYFNRLVWMLPNGQLGYYDKKHLFSLANEDRYYSAGNKRLIASVKGWKINLQVCYDLRFPVWSRNVITEKAISAIETIAIPSYNTAQAGDARPEYDLLINVANWPEKRSHAWKTLLCARAIENQCYVVGVNRVGVDGNDLRYSGDSVVIDPLGESLYHCANAEDVFTITLGKDKLDDIRRKLPFWKDADRFTLE